MGLFYHNILVSKDLTMDEKQEVFENITGTTAGEMLRNARTTGRRKREIATIAKLLCIREEFLTALEEGNYRVIPEDVYILGFARSYAVELGLNPDEVIDKLKRELGIIVDDEEEKKEVKIEKPRKTPKITKENIVKYCKSVWQYVKKHWIWFASGLAVVIIAIVLSIVLLSGHGDKTEVASNETVSETTIENPAQNAEKIADPDFRYPVRERFNEKSKKESRVVLQAEKESWVKIEDARGNTAFSRVLVPGDVYYLPLSDKFKGTFGNAGGIDVWVDRRLIKKVGPANTRKSGISMAPDALKANGFAE